MLQNIALLTFVLLTGVVQSGQAQSLKVGDFVDAHVSGGWLPCTVSKPLQANEYGVSCGPSDYTVTASPQPACSTCGAIRARVATLQDRLIAMETAGALLQLASRGINRFLVPESPPANGPGA